MGIFPKKINLRKPATVSKLFEQSVDGFFKVFHASPGGMCLTRVDGSIVVDVNRNFTEFFGYTYEEIIGRITTELGIIEHNEQTRLKEIIRQRGRLNNDEVKCRHKDGHVVHCLVTSQPVNIAGMNYTLSSYTDISKIKEQSAIIKTQHKDIFESIIYARRIQDAIFPPEELIKKNLPESFVLFKPKAIVSGDFYWMETSGDKTYIAAADCTGHGVPGALLSIIGHTLLTKIHNRGDVLTPAEILNELSLELFKTLRQNFGGINLVNDTMNIALISIDEVNSLLEYAGAFNPAYIVRRNELIRLSADRFSISARNNQTFREFTSHTLRLLREDTIYLFSDGYASQFGGPDNEKFKSIRLQQLLLSLQNHSMAEQKEILAGNFEEWKDGEEQVDDILIVGIRI
jgi:PAS domain S-box-containing protein